MRLERTIKRKIPRITPSERAEQLLIEHLNEKQVEEYRTHRQFIVHGKHGSYLIGRSRNYFLEIPKSSALTRRRIVRRDLTPVSQEWDLTCAVRGFSAVRESIPVADVYLGQKLFLEAQEVAVLRAACGAPAPPPRLRREMPIPF